MENSEEKKSTPMNKPPVPPPGIKKPSNLPKGPVPPRGQTPGMPRIPGMPGAGAGGPGLTPPLKPPMMTPTNKPLIPGQPAMPSLPGMNKPPQVGGVPPVLPPASPVTPFENKLNEAESHKSDLEQKVTDLEKKLMEEKEKVLLASLRTKEEEAVSAKVESSIKDIQDKLRREKREQELEENKKKAEARLLEVERRLAEEREAWVTTLKNQIGQRDQMTQEMESHFSARLKDLEYRWAQEKSSLEANVRDREAEIIRIRHEMSLKAEQEKAFWEDRLKSVSGEKERIERDYDRLKDKFHSEKEQLFSERQILKDQTQKLESSLRFFEEQSRVEKSIIQKESDGKLSLLKQQSEHEKSLWERQVSQLNEQLHSFQIEIKEKAKIVETIQAENSNLNLKMASQLHEFEIKVKEKEKEIDALQSQVIVIKRSLEEATMKARADDLTLASQSREITDLNSRLNQLENNLNREVEKATQIEKEKSVSAQEKTIFLQAELDNLKRVSSDKERDSSVKISRYEDKVQSLTDEVLRSKELSKEQVLRIQNEYESRLKTLQSRLDHYDSNAHREYEQAREKVKAELVDLQKQVESFKKKEEEMSQIHQGFISQIEELKNSFNHAATDKNNLEKQLESLRSEWKEGQWELENRVRELSDQLREEHSKAQHQEDIKANLEQELKQRQGALESLEAMLKERKSDVESKKQHIENLDRQLSQEKTSREVLEKELKQRASGIEYSESQLKERKDEIEALKNQLMESQRQIEHEQSVGQLLKREIEGFKTLSHSNGLEALRDLQIQLNEKNKELEKVKESLHGYRNLESEIEKKEILFRDKEKVFKQLLSDKEETISDLKSRVHLVERKLDETNSNMAQFKEEAKNEVDKARILNKKDFDRQLQLKEEESMQKLSQLQKMAKEEMMKMEQAHRAMLDSIRQKHTEELERVSRQSASSGPDISEATVQQLKSQIEMEFMNRLKDQETEFESRINKVKEDSKKEIERLKWEADHSKEEVKKAKEARLSIEREAQELLQQAENHYRNELNKFKKDIYDQEKKNAGVFTKLGRLLDTPIVDTKKEKDIKDKAA